MELEPLLEPEDNPKSAYMPSPSQIAEECRLIQATWSEDERYLRRGGHLDLSSDWAALKRQFKASRVLPGVTRRKES